MRRSANAGPRPSSARRRVPRVRQLLALIGLRAPRLDRTAYRIERAQSILDLRAQAHRRTPRAVFDYVDGAAENERSLARSRRSFAALEFRPRVLRDVAAVDTGTTILGRAATLPLVLAPTGFTRMMHHEGEVAVARAATRLGVPYALSTMGTTSPERLAEEAPDVDRWFQLYIWRDRGIMRELLERAAATGHHALVLTVDSAIPGSRRRDMRNGLTVPPSLTPRTLFDIALHPVWWANLLTTEPLQFAALSSFDGTVAELSSQLFDPSVTFDDLDDLRAMWSGPLVVKGVQSVQDARAVVEHGADALVLSNHGGRQLDRAPTPLEQLPEVVDAVGDRAEIYLDGGILDGADVVAAVALGARACLVGRAYLYGLMAGGQAGVERAGEILRTDMVRTLQLLGVPSVAELEPSDVSLPSVASGPSTGPSTGRSDDGAVVRRR